MRFSNSRRRPDVFKSPAGLTLFATLVALVLPASVLAQGSPSRGTDAPTGVFTERVDVRVINVDVTVTDRRGQSITGLSRDDFELIVNGEPMEITNFYSRSDEALEAPQAAATERRRDPSFRSLEEIQQGAERRSHVVILVDHTRLRASNRKRAFNALRRAVERLSNDDLIAVVGIEGNIVFYTDFLFDKQGVYETLDTISKVSLRTDVNEVERRRIFGELQRGISGGIQARASLAEEKQLSSRIRAYAAEEYARGIRTLQQIETVVSTFAGVEGRKTLFYVGEGVPTRPGEGMYVELRNRFSGPERGLPQQDFNTDYTREIGRYDLIQPMRQLAKAANRAGVTMYAIDAENSHGGLIRSALTEQGATSEAITLVNENYREPLEFASQATGGRLLTSSGQLVEQLGNLIGGIRAYYSLGFTPPTTWAAGSDHDIKVRVKNREFRVNHPEEVRLPEPDEREANATVAALLYQTVDNPLAIKAKPGSEVPREDGNAALPVNLEIPIKNIEFLPGNGTQSASLSIYVSTKDAQGNPGKVQKIPFHLNIPDDKMEEARANSAHYPLPLVVRSGDRQVAIGIRDNNSRRFSAVRLDIGQFTQF